MPTAIRSGGTRRLAGALQPLSLWPLAEQAVLQRQALADRLPRSRSRPEQEPTLFEWAGGFPALTRMTRIFYGRYVPQDPLLAPLFANMSPDHPERVAAWLGEVFGGPKAYSEGYGGYERMVSQHLGKALREEQRARWVELLSKSADDAMLPPTPSGAPPSSPTWNGARGSGSRTPSPAPIRRRTCRCRAGGGSATRRRAGGSPPWSPRSLRAGRPSRPRRACQLRAARQAAVPRA